MTVTFVRCSDDDRKTYLLFDLPGKFRRPFSVYVDQHRHSGHGRPVRYDTGPYELGRHLVSDNDGGLPPTLGKGIRCSRSTADVLRVLNHPGILIGLRAFQGIALAGIYVSYMPLLLATTDESRHGHILGQAVALTYLGLSLGPVIGGALTEFIGWRCIFLLAAALVLLSYLFIRPVRQEWYENGAPFVNAVSSVLSASAILCTLYGLSSFSDNSLFFYAGLVLSVIFVLHEGRSFHPLLPLYLFRNLTFSMSNLAALIQYSATYAVSFLLSLYLQVILGLTPAVSGAVLLIQPLVMAVLSPRAGDLSDKYGPRGIASLGLILTAPGLLAFAVLPDISVGQGALCLAIIGMGAALFGAPNNSAIMGSVKKMHHGIASSVLALSRNLGQAFSMAAVTFIMTAETEQAAAYKDGVLSAFHISFLLLSVLCLFAAAASLARGSSIPKHH